MILIGNPGVPCKIVKRSIVSRPEWLSWRLPNVNASEISALTGDHHFLSRYGLWMLKSGKIEPESTNEEKDRGNELEPIALGKAFKDHPNWRLSGTEKYYYSHPDWRIGATPDEVAWHIDGHRIYRILLEIKTITDHGFKKYWSDGPPLHVLDQARVGMWLTECSHGVIACMVLTYSGALRMEYFDIAQDEQRLHVLRDETSKFWKSIEDNQPPEPDFGRDIELIQKAVTANGAEIDLSGDNEVLELRDKYQVHKFSVAQSESRLREIKGQMLVKMRGASRAIVNGEPIAVVTMCTKKAHTVKESTYPVFKFMESKNE